jgi:hypothetical protein
LTPKFLRLAGAAEAVKDIGPSQARCAKEPSKSLGKVLGEGFIDRGCLLGRAESGVQLLPSGGANPPECPQARGEVGQVGGGFGLGQPPIGRDGLLGGGQCAAVVPDRRQPDPEVVQGAGEVGQVGGGFGLGQPPIGRAVNVGIIASNACSGSSIASSRINRSDENPRPAPEIVRALNFNRLPFRKMMASLPFAVGVAAT